MPYDPSREQWEEIFWKSQEEKAKRIYLDRGDSFTMLQALSHQIAKDHGWYDNPENANIPTKLALIHSEISEALEEFRNGKTDVYFTPTKERTSKPEGFGIELADAVIRIMDLAEYLSINLSGLIILKQEYNRTRPYRHGGKAI